MFGPYEDWLAEVEEIYEERENEVFSERAHADLLYEYWSEGKAPEDAVNEILYIEAMEA
jgi:hypothetical protein